MIIPQSKALALFAAAASLAFAQNPVIQAVDARADHYGKLSRQIWENPEVGFQETKSSALLRDDLKSAGFRISDGVAGMPTAFIAEWGSGAPVIAILGEFDALPGLSQEDTTARKPRVEGAPGHGCGHNLFGSASALAAVAVKEQMEKRGLKGTIRFYGTPAEEGGGGKIYMIRAGLFKDVDVALAWHPWDRNEVDDNPWLANISARIRYRGKAAHAAAAPEAGRSALDAFELMAHGVNLLREHVPQETRMHYVVIKGGTAANVVPDETEVSLIVRHPDAKTLENIWERVLNCVQAGALATGTQVSFEITSSYANLVPVRSMISLMNKSLQTAGGVNYSREERKFAEALRSNVDLTNAPPLGTEAKVLPTRTALVSASTDVGDVSWNVPTGQVLVATFPPGIPLHTWLSTACAGTSLARKGMVVAAKALALAATDLLSNPELVKAAKQDWQDALKGRAYRSLLPADRKPSPR